VSSHWRSHGWVEAEAPATAGQEAAAFTPSADIELLRVSMTIRLDAMLVFGLSRLFAALKLT
jgi:hypothetical protein